MSTTRLRATLAAGATLAAIGTGFALAPSALASHGGNDPRVITRGHCSATSHWKVAARLHNSQLRGSFEVHSRVGGGQAWDWTFSQNGTQQAAGTSATDPTSLEFQVEKRFVDAAGTDTVSFTATNQVTGETCAGSASI